MRSRNTHFAHIDKKCTSLLKPRWNIARPTFRCVYFIWLHIWGKGLINKNSSPRSNLSTIYVGFPIWFCWSCTSSTAIQISWRLVLTPMYIWSELYACKIIRLFRKRQDYDNKLWYMHAFNLSRFHLKSHGFSHIMHIIWVWHIVDIYTIFNVNFNDSFAFLVIFFKFSCVFFFSFFFVCCPLCVGLRVLALRQTNTNKKLVPTP